ncbi:hypothetical protein BKA62DRAFT_635540 [Auriculariales sp. MPI-PUGE-AT-0066]|nr:hypothetical protein BKA62DRAFT_635540 [Auriculariales sp. MPI-PUGE-AT-0066]
MSTRSSTTDTMLATDSAQLQDTEKGADAVSGSPRAGPRPFTHSWKDPAIAGPRAGFVKGLVGGLVLTMVAIFAILPVYWGAFWRAPQHAHNLNVVVVDLDGGAIGQALRTMFTSPQITGAQTQLTYNIAPSGEFANAEAVAEYVTDEHAWAAVVVSSGATQNLQSAISSRSTSYNASQVITLYLNTARNENATPRFIQPQLTPVLERFSEQFAVTNAQGLAASTDLAGLLSTAPALVTRPVSFSTIELRAFDVPVAAAVDFVGLIYLLIIAFLVAMMNYNIRVMSGLNKLLNLRTLLVIRFVVPFLLYFAMSWIYSFISLAFQVPFSRHYGHGGFILYWISSYLGMLALGLAIESIITLLTPRFIPYFLILWIISNVSVAFFPIQVLPGVFRYGYAMPFYNIGQIVRTLLFGTKNHLGLNYGILIVWIAISCVTLTLFTVFMRRKEEREAAAAPAPGAPGAPRQ